MSYSVNYARKQISVLTKNYEFLLDNSSTSNKSLYLRFCFDISVSELKRQADIFAFNYKAHSYVNLPRILRVKDDEFEQVVRELYIYSFAKSFYNAVFFNKISNDSNLGYVLKGHSCLFRLLRNPVSQDFSETDFVSYTISLGTEAKKQAMFLQLLSAFPFLNRYKDEMPDAFGTIPFFINDYEAYLNRLMQDQFSGNAVQQGDSSFLVTGNITDSLGRLTLSDLSSIDDTSILSFSNNPIANCFKSPDGKKLYFFPVVNGVRMEFNPSFSFSMANFIKLDYNNDKDIINKYYYSIDLSDSQKHLILSDIYTISGIKCRTVNVSGGASSNIEVPTLDDIIKVINSYNNDFEKVLNKIKQVTDSGKTFIEYITEINNTLNLK